MGSPAKNKHLYSLRKSPTQARSRATIDAILSAATRVLLEIGYDKASTNKIAEVAGVGVGSLYEYFPGKEAIFAEIRRREDERLFDLTMNREEPDSIRELIRRNVTLYLEFVRSNLELHSALVNDVPQFAVGANELPFYREFIPWSKKFFERHKDELRLDTDLNEASEFGNRVVRATINNYVLYAPEKLNDPAIEEHLKAMLERYYLKDA